MNQAPEAQNVAQILFDHASEHIMNFFYGQDSTVLRRTLRSASRANGLRTLEE